MSALHVLVHQRDRHDKVDIESIDDVCDHANHYSQRRVLEVCELDVHWPELDSPADVRVCCWWVFEPQ